MSNERRQEKALDAALDDGSTRDEETQPLVDTAARVKQTLAVDVPPADRQRALFLSGVASRERTGFSPLRLLVPALAIAIVIFAGLAGQNALPGQSLYPVREAMNTVGIGRSPVAEVDDYCEEAVRLIRRAEASLDADPEGAIALAVQAIEQLGPARRLLPELNVQREEWLEWVEDLEEDAVEIIAEASEEQEEEEEEGSDDSSGPGSDGSGNDNFGPGSDDSGGDDSGGHDNSGPGSDDSSGDDSGSGSDDSDGDDSGSGSDDSGSGSDDSDSSGSGSGGDDSSGSGSGDDDSSGSG